MPYINFSVLQKNFSSQPGDIFLRNESLIGVWIIKDRVHLNFGGAFLEVHFNPKDKDSESEAKRFANDLMAGKTDIAEYVPKIVKYHFDNNSMLKQ